MRWWSDGIQCNRAALQEAFSDSDLRTCLNWHDSCRKLCREDLSGSCPVWHEVQIKTSASMRKCVASVANLIKFSPSSCWQSSSSCPHQLHYIALSLWFLVWISSQGQEIHVKVNTQTSIYLNRNKFKKYIYMYYLNSLQFQVQFWCKASASLPKKAKTDQLCRGMALVSNTFHAQVLFKHLQTMSCCGISVLCTCSHPCPSKSRRPVSSPPIRTALFKRPANQGARCRARAKFVAGPSINTCRFHTFCSWIKKKSWVKTMLLSSTFE